MVVGALHWPQLWSLCFDGSHACQLTSPTCETAAGLADRDTSEMGKSLGTDSGFLLYYCHILTQWEHRSHGANIRTILYFFSSFY